MRERDYYRSIVQRDLSLFLFSTRWEPSGTFLLLLSVAGAHDQNVHARTNILKKDYLDTNII